MTGHHQPDELKITAIYVLSKLDEHTKECGRRWWSVMLTLLGGFGTLFVFMAGLIATLVFKGHGP